MNHFLPHHISQYNWFIFTVVPASSDSSHKDETKTQNYSLIHTSTLLQSLKASIIILFSLNTAMHRHDVSHVNMILSVYFLSWCQSMVIALLSHPNIAISWHINKQRFIKSIFSEKLTSSRANSESPGNS